MKKVKKVGAKCHYNNRILNKCLVLLLSLLFFGCGTSNDDTSSQTDLQELTKIEVTEYEGKDLSSLTDFRERQNGWGSCPGHFFVRSQFSQNYRLESRHLV